MWVSGDDRRVFVGYHASQEQIPPSGLLDAVTRAERAGFDGAFTANHIAPWTPQQGHAGNATVWLGAALASTSAGFSVGSISTPGQRNHPVVVAHEFATLAEMFPRRFFAVMGSGELLNEHMVGHPWPVKDERTARLGESVEVIRRLLGGEEVTHRGRVTADRARLWTLPAVPPMLWAAGTSTATAQWAAGWADGFMTVGASPQEARPLLKAYRDAGGRGETAVQVHFAFGDTRADALAVVREQWSHGVITPPDTWEVRTPEDFVALAGTPTEDELSRTVVVGTSVDEIADRLCAIAGGFDRIYLHDISQTQDHFLEELAPHLIASLKAPGRVLQSR